MIQQEAISVQLRPVYTTTGSFHVGLKRSDLGWNQMVHGCVYNTDGISEHRSGSMLWFKWVQYFCLTRADMNGETKWHDSGLPRINRGHVRINRDHARINRESTAIMHESCANRFEFMRYVAATKCRTHIRFPRVTCTCDNSVIYQSGALPVTRLGLYRCQHNVT